jgi:aspartyl-tRNA(Asn)/glutamyl-tRNA(Gln) amidotransferase subunit A
MVYEKSLNELSKLLQDGNISSVEICKVFLERIETLDSAINAYITVIPDRLLEEAAESDKRRASGNPLSPFDGIPIAVKDNIITRGILTTCGSKILENFEPPFNSFVSEKLEEAGFLILGKTNMDEFAMGSTTETSHFGPTRNPYDNERVPGGSSGGSAAAVSALMAPAAIGSDTGGSIRQPASFCGVVGIKPTYGRVSRYGLVAFASSLDQVGTLANSVEDAAALLAAISGVDVRDGTSVDREIDFHPGQVNADIKGMTVGVPDEYFKGVSPDITGIIEQRIKDLEGMGASIKKISLKYIDYAIPVYYLIATAEASSNLARYDGISYGYRSGDAGNLADLYNKTRSSGFGKEVKRRIILGTFGLSSGYYDAYYLKALKGRTLIIHDFMEAFKSVDVIVSPVTTTSAFKLGEMTDDPLQMYMSDILTTSANLAGIPGISVPVGLDPTGLPVGMQVVGNHFREKSIFTVAMAIEGKSGSIRPSL